MNKTLTSLLTKSAALLGGYLAALSVVRTLSGSFNFYIREIIGDWLKMDLPYALLLFTACMALLMVSVWRAEGHLRFSWRSIDFSLLLVIFFCIELLCVYYVRYANPFQGYAAFLQEYAAPMLGFSLVAYGAAMAMLMETTAHLRDQTLVKTLCWPRFFRIYGLRWPMGSLMAFLLAGHLWYLIMLCPMAAVQGRLNTFLLLCSVFTLAALTYFCAHLLSLSAEYEKANVEKIRAERFKAELITNVSHDIRTPLTVIISYVNLLKGLPVEQEDFQEYVAVLDRKAARLKTLICDLLEASKAATGNIAVDLQKVDLPELVGQLAGEFDEQFAERGLNFVLRQPDEPVFVKADSRHLWRVLENLFGNAAKYALPGTRVFAEIRQDNGQTVLWLKNTSQNPIDLPSDALTEQFIRGDQARRTDGNGLGLYIAKSLVELMSCQFRIQVTGDLFVAEIIYPRG